MARINFAKNFAGEIYATQNWTTAQINEKVASLGNVFELKGLVDQLPETAELGDVYLVSEQLDGISYTFEYVYTANGFEKLGAATSSNTYATKSYVDATFVEKAQLKGGKGVSVTEGEDKNFTFEAIVSNAEGNKIQLTDAGLYVAECEKVVLTEKDTATVDMTVNDYEISANVKVSADANNILEAKADGLYVAKPLEISVEDTATIGLEIVNGKITANAIGLGVKGDAGNSFVIAQNAQTVWAAISALDGVVNQLQGGGEGQEGIVSRVEKVEKLAKKNARNIVDLDANITSVNTTVSAIIDDNATIKTSVNGAISDIATVKSGVDGAIADITKLETGVNATIADIATVKGSVNGAISDIAKLEGGVNGAIADIATVKSGVDGAIADIAKLETGVNGAIADVKKVVTELADVATLKSKSVTLSKQEGVATAIMGAGEIVFAILDANNQVYPDVVYTAEGATLTANYGEQAIPDTWTVWYGKVATFTTPSTNDVDATAEVGALTAASVEATSEEIGALTAASVDATATVGAVTATAIGDLTASDATMEDIEGYADTELN